jgi:H+/Cl- antiporter ClcA
MALRGAPDGMQRPFSYLTYWLVLAGPLGLAVGTACALFLWALERVTEFRYAYPALLYLLPFAGAGVAALYQSIGGRAAGGTDLLMEEIHQPGGGVPRRMAPLILVATVVTHLFGGSAGREGTAVQMGGAMAAAFARLWNLDADHKQLLLMCGIAAGFGGVFGTPLAGALFAVEVLTLGKMRLRGQIPCLIAAFFGNWGCHLWGMTHTHYAVTSHVARFDWLLLLKVAVAAVAFGLVSRLFAELTHALQGAFKKIPSALARPFVGGLCIIALVALVGNRDYLGLGVTSPDPGAVTILSSFTPGGADTFSWAWKLVFTAVTLSCGFKGGEVTPLFYIGATLGHVLGLWLGAPVDLFAAVGFVAVFAGATNTPWACCVMGVELFGGQLGPYFLIGCFVAYLCSGHSGIYASQRVGRGKHRFHGLPAEATIGSVRQSRCARHTQQEGRAPSGKQDE